MYRRIIATLITGIVCISSGNASLLLVTPHLAMLVSVTEDVCRAIIETFIIGIVCISSATCFPPLRMSPVEWCKLFSPSIGCHVFAVAKGAESSGANPHRRTVFLSQNTPTGSIFLPRRHGSSGASDGAVRT